MVEVFQQRMSSRHGWDPLPGRGRTFTDVLQAFEVTIDLLTSPGDGVAIEVPAYPMFLELIASVGRRVVPIGDGDSEVLARDWRSAGVSLVVVVNPHNPTGRRLREPELTRLAEAASAADVPVLSDEIHADLVLDGGPHLPFGALSDDARDRTITVTSASKAFNLAGLRCAVAHVGHQPLLDRLTAKPLTYFGGPSSLSRAASVAAWTQGDPWLTELVAELRDRRDRVSAWAAERGVGVVAAEASYLAWLDFSGTSIADDPAGRILRDGRVRLSAGPEFSAHTTIDTGAFARLNFGTSAEMCGTTALRSG